MNAGSTNTPVEGETIFIEQWAGNQDASDIGAQVNALMQVAGVIARQLERIADASEGRNQ